jgi:hypothetical protein
VQPGERFAAFEELVAGPLLEPDAAAVGFAQAGLKPVELVDLARREHRAGLGQVPHGPS